MHSLIKTEVSVPSTKRPSVSNSESPPIFISLMFDCEISITMVRLELKVLHEKMFYGKKIGNISTSKNVIY
jgi:hypothetical protein